MNLYVHFSVSYEKVFRYLNVADASITCLLNVQTPPAGDIEHFFPIHDLKSCHSNHSTSGLLLSDLQILLQIPSECLSILKIY